MGRVLIYVVPVALAIYALIDLWRSRREERAGLHPALWVAIIVLLPVLGPVSWIFTSLYLRSQMRGAGGPARPSRPIRPGRPPRRQGPVAPDDDPDFLWRLERERRRREQGGGAGAAEGDAAPPPPSDGPAQPPSADGDADGPTRGSGRDAGAGKDDDGRG
ncbi:MAG: PLDc_N domain-containing protein [Actinotalea sp.]|nr:PLDc_N domain-containing protein [Actinotalea sp.]